jgi:hypothetical protein
MLFFLSFLLVRFAFYHRLLRCVQSPEEQVGFHAS